MGVKIRGLYIPSMELPADEPARIVINPNGQVFADHSTWYSEYKAIPVPEHGKLIEAEPIQKYITDGLNSGDLGYDAIKIMTEIEYAPPFMQEGQENGPPRAAAPTRRTDYDL